MLHFVTNKFCSHLFALRLIDGLSFTTEVNIIAVTPKGDGVLCFGGWFLSLSARACVCVPACVWYRERRKVRVRVLFIHLAE